VEAIMMDGLQIFVSYKSTDFEKATALEKIIRRYTDGAEFKIAKNMTSGEDWSHWIRNNLKISDILLLLYTDPTAEWDWCLYEAGLFTPLDAEEYRRVICLYAADSEPPRPLKLLQGVPATKDDIKTFLGTLLKTNEYAPNRQPLRSDLDDDALDAPAAEIAALFSPTVRQVVPLIPSLSVLIPHEETIQDDDLPAGACVQLHAGAGEIIANLLLEQTTWSALRQAVPRQEGTFWLDELARAARAVAHGQKPEPISSTFRAARSGHIYRPVILRVGLIGERPFNFVVGLVPEYEPESEFIGDESGRVFHLIRIANRFRWEVIEPFTRRAARLHNADEREVYCTQLRESVALIEAASERFGYLDEDNVVRAFQEPGDVKLVKDLYKLWYSAREKLFDGIVTSDVEAIAEQLQVLKKANRKFMAMATRRYASLFGHEGNQGRDRRANGDG
jgi:hypothetical protein